MMPSTFLTHAVLFLDPEQEQQAASSLFNMSDLKKKNKINHKNAPQENSFDKRLDS